MSKRVISLKELYMVCYILLIFSFPTHEFIKNDSFIVMTNLLQRENFAVDHWEVIIKEQLTKAQTNELLQQKLPIVNLKQEDEQAKTYHFNINFKTDLTVQVKLIVPKDHHAKSELMTVIKHNHLNTSVIESYKHVKTFLNERF